MRQHETSLGELGESGILERLFPIFRHADEAVTVGPGDDCAVVRTSGELVFTTDAMVEGYDFLLGISDPMSIGRKAAVQNLADVASMGAKPRWLLTTVLAGKDTPIAVLEGIAEGIALEAHSHGASVIGGDLGTARELTISITAIGELRAPGTAVVRSGARAGDVLAVGGDLLGLSSAGLAQVLGKADAALPDIEAGGGAVARLAKRALAWHLAPEPAIARGWNSGCRASAMIDISDGLVRDASRIARASGVNLDLSRAALESDRALLAPLADIFGVDAMEWVLGSGEEHLMLATFPANVWAESTEVRAEFREIGRVLPCEGEGTVLLDGAPLAMHGWDHFSL
ncbi:thiamine-phosphate kinase [Dermabacter sp. HSID17554]|uniref:thiamine-phosphate kinase n=1 Tax=Dermabacter sp. HSID17554 TaxID=2419511 RepID=UPI000F879480|nr:thiamine-phosphate kinase [Dermabacter sp. HSID17554]RUP87349.1 thiamine-phosphate kinase [Dermabacter sp. HSID17554]